MNRKLYSLGIFIFFLIVTGCDNNLLHDEQGELVRTDLNQLSIPGFSEATLVNLQDIPRRELDLPDELKRWETDVAVLRDSIAAYDGQIGRASCRESMMTQW